METSPYSGREQTETKHFILKAYLQELAFKVLSFSDLAYVDGFSGPWETRTEDFADSSFMIAIQVLKDAQRQLAERGINRKIHCFFCERNEESFQKLSAAVAIHNDPESGFHIQAFCGEFMDAVDDIQKFVGNSFALIFIDPKGWTGYDLEIIKPLLVPRNVEVIINYMYDFINRAVNMSDTKTIASFDPILGGPGWMNRLDQQLVRIDKGRAVEKLFRETLKATGEFDFVVSTIVLRPTIDRAHFFLAYGTKSKDGLSAFRETEFKALKKQAENRSNAKERKRELESGLTDMFAGFEGAMQSARVEDNVVSEEKRKAREFILELIKNGPTSFEDVWIAVLQQFVLRVTNVKDICKALAKEGVIADTWTSKGKRKPEEESLIRMKVP